MQLLNFDYTFAKYLYTQYKHIEFNEKEHTYKDKLTGKKLLSVTQSLKLFEPEFNADYWAGVKAKERNISKEDMLQEWENIKQLGLARGNTYHDYIEKRHNKESVLDSIDEIERYLDETRDDIPLLSEYIIGNDCIAGKFDHLCIRGGHLVLQDWKSNVKFNIESPYKLINGLEHLPNTEFYKYALQVSLYKYILDLEDIKELEVVWFNKATYQIFKMPYLKDEVQHIHQYVNSRAHSSN